MRIRSKKLWQYLIETNALNGTEEDIIKAKVQYRKMYKREWKKKQRLPKKELHPVFSLKEFHIIKLKANKVGLHPSTYVKQIVIASLQSTDLLPNKEQLQKVLQLISISVISLKSNQLNLSQIAIQLEEAEKLLLQYLHLYDCQNSFSS